jgi:hypothetical protein
LSRRKQARVGASPYLERSQEMTETTRLSTWVYVLVQHHGTEEQLVGQHDSETDISFIPAFMNKEAAMQGVVHMAKEKGYKYEIQAILVEDLLKYAANGNFFTFVLDDEGAVSKKFSPDGRQL